MDKLLQIKNLTVEFQTKHKKQIKTLKAVDNVSLDIYEGEVLGIIGESGSGKSTLASAILNLVSSSGKISSGEIHYLNKENLLALKENQYNNYRWSEISTVFQAAQNALNPINTIEKHFVETYYCHKNDKSKEELLKYIEELLSFVMLDKNVLKLYPFELSGGMKQRVLIALSLLLDPKLIILDEPTTALDVITQWYILEILRKINKTKNITLIFLTHDISIIASMVDRIAVMYAGEIVEVGNVIDVYDTPKHPYTKALLSAIPTLDGDILEKKSIYGTPINMLELGNECRFKSRCEIRNSLGCNGERENSNELICIKEGHFTRCKPLGAEING